MNGKAGEVVDAEVLAGLVNMIIITMRRACQQLPSQGSLPNSHGEDIVEVVTVEFVEMVMIGRA